MALATFQVLYSCVWLLAATLGSADIGTFDWTMLF